MNDAIPAPVQSLLALFDERLANVRFPDVDGPVLVAAAAEVSAQADTVQRAEAALELARAALAEGQEALLARAQRALAYARIYAEDDEALSSALGAINISRGARKPPRANGPASSSTATFGVVGGLGLEGRPLDVAGTSPGANLVRRGRRGPGGKDATPTSLFAVPSAEGHATQGSQALAEPMTLVGA